MKKMIFLFSKDALSLENLPIYGNPYWKTPNLDELAAKGTVFFNHHTAASSTSMAFSSMLTGKYPYEFVNRKRYVHVPANEERSIFSILQEQGYDCHILWSSDFMTGAWPYVREFGEESKTHIHIVDMHQPAGLHREPGQELVRSDSRAEETVQNIIRELLSIEKTERQFIWLHLPHVLKGRVSYGDDIDLMDRILGFVRERYGDDSIFVTADHGNMNFHKNIMAYGFHVYELTCRVPLITPRIDGKEKVFDLTSHVDLPTLLIEERITARDHVFVDSQYYAQPDRKLAVIGKRYKYIYNKRGKREELYDLQWDPEERFDLLEVDRYDEDKKILRNTQELYFYPYRDRIPEAYAELKRYKDEIWRVGTFRDEAVCYCRDAAAKVKRRLRAGITIWRSSHRKKQERRTPGTR